MATKTDVKNVKLQIHMFTRNHMVISIKMGPSSVN